MARPKIVYDFEANTVKLVSELQKARKSLQGMSSDLKLIKFDSIVNLGERAFRAGQQIYQLAASTAAFGSDLQRNARAMGMTISSYQEWLYVAKAADVETEQFFMGIRNLTNVMNDSPKKLEQLGISTRAIGGNFKTIDEILPEIVNKMSGMTDVSKQNAVAMDLFGSRSGMAFANLVREGKNVDEIRKRFKDLNLEIGEDHIKRLAESEQAFKDLGFAFTKLKASLSPLVVAMSEFVSLITKLITDLPKLPQALPSWMKLDMSKGGATYPGGVGIGGAPLISGQMPAETPREADRWKKWVSEEYRRTGIGGGMGGFTEEQRKTILEERNQYERDFWDLQKAVWEMENNILKTSQDYMALMHDRPPTEEELFRILSRQREELQKQKDLEDQLLQAVQDRETAIQGAVFGGEANMYDYGRLISLEQYEADVKKSTQSTMEFGKIASDAFGKLGSGLTTLIDSSASFGDRMKAIFSDMANSVISSLAKATIQMAIFGNMEGSVKSGKGWGTIGQSGYGGLVGVVGSILGSLQTGTEFVPQTGLYQLHRGESVIPASDKGGGGGYTFIQITANDAKSFVDMAERNPEGIIRVTQRSARKGGSMRQVLRSY